MGNAGNADTNPDEDPKWIEAIRQGLLDWYERGHRELPWRRDRDAYRILVSETMLVQTTVAAVVPFFDRFLTQFPTIEALAEAEPSDVLKAWEGLGYYRRARQLQAAAKAVVTLHNGVIPDNVDAILALPGVGRYIAGALLSFAFDRAAPIVEANTQRVLGRLLALREDIRASSTQKRLWQAAERLVSPTDPGKFNQAFMELGATVCTPREPMCLICPVSAQCRAKTLGIQDLLPTKTARKKPLEVVESCALVVRDNQLLIVQRGPNRLWEGFWEFPTIHETGVDPAIRSFANKVSLAEGVFLLTGVQIAVGDALKTIKFGVTQYQVMLTAYRATARSGVLVPGPGMIDARFASGEEIGQLAMGSRIRKLADWAIETLLNGD